MRSVICKGLQGCECQRCLWPMLSRQHGPKNLELKYFIRRRLDWLILLLRVSGEAAVFYPHLLLQREPSSLETARRFLVPAICLRAAPGHRTAAKAKAVPDPPHTGLACARAMGTICNEQGQKTRLMTRNQINQPGIPSPNEFLNSECHPQRLPWL